MADIPCTQDDALASFDLDGALMRRAAAVQSPRTSMQSPPQQQQRGGVARSPLVPRQQQQQQQASGVASFVLPASLPPHHKSTLPPTPAPNAWQPLGADKGAAGRGGVGSFSPVPKAASPAPGPAAPPVVRSAALSLPQPIARRPVAPPIPPPHVAAHVSPVAQANPPQPAQQPTTNWIPAPRANPAAAPYQQQPPQQYQKPRQPVQSPPHGNQWMASKPMSPAASRPAAAGQVSMQGGIQPLAAVRAPALTFARGTPPAAASLPQRISSPPPPIAPMRPSPSAAPLSATAAPVAATPAPPPSNIWTARAQQQQQQQQHQRQQPHPAAQQSPVRTAPASHFSNNSNLSNAQAHSRSSVPSSAFAAPTSSASSAYAPSARSMPPPAPRTPAAHPAAAMQQPSPRYPQQTNVPNPWQRAPPAQPPSVPSSAFAAAPSAQAAGAGSARPAPPPGFKAGVPMLTSSLGAPTVKSGSAMVVEVGGGGAARSAAPSSAFAAASASTIATRTVTRAPTIAPLSSNFSLPGQSVSSARALPPSSPPRARSPSEPLPSLEERRAACNRFLSEKPHSRRNELEPEAIAEYIYPSHLKQREYQRDITWTALRHNTLVCLPTGTGKTVIAAVCLYNFFRWFPRGKLLFMAPTRPLVVQQASACLRLVDIPEENVAVVIGGSSDIVTKKNLWQSDLTRVIFATPQAVSADVDKGIVPLDRIVFVCIDECHRAQKDYAYVPLVRKMNLSGHDFRVLGLSATPGNDLRAVKELARNLNIERIELRDEHDPDLAPHLFEREVEKVVVSSSNASIGMLRDKFNECLRPHLQQLVNSRRTSLQVSDPDRVSAFQLQQAISSFQGQSDHLPSNVKASVLGELGMLRKMLMARDALKDSVKASFAQLQRHIIGDERGQVEDKKQGRKAPTNAVCEMRNSHSFKQLREMMQASIRAMQDAMDGVDEDASITSSAAAASSASSAAPGPSTAAQLRVLRAHHPKQARLAEIVLDHFRRAAEKAEWTADDEDSDDEDRPLAKLRGSSSTATPLSLKGCRSQSNVLVFTDNRASVEELVSQLNRFPAIRASAFIGQAKKGMNQKEQAKVLDRFRSGELNLLVCTCVAEEGLDIGHIDLIVSFDVISSPLRIVQRFGRTGRKRRGRCVTIVTEGNEEAAYEHAWKAKNALVHELKQKGRKPFFVRQTSVPLLPPEIVPREVLVSLAQQTSTPAKSRKRKASGAAESARSMQKQKRAQEQDNSWILPPAASARIQSLRAAHAGVAQEAPSSPTLPLVSSAVYNIDHTRLSRRMVELYASMLRDTDGERATDEPAAKRQKLAEKASNQLDAMFGAADGGGAMDISPTPPSSDSARSSSLTRSVSPARVVDSITTTTGIAQAPVSVPPTPASAATARQNGPAPASVSAPQSTLQAMFAKQKAAAAEARATSESSKKRRRQLNFTEFTKDEVFPLPSVVFLSLLSAASQQLFARLVSRSRQNEYPSKRQRRCRRFPTLRGRPVSSKIEERAAKLELVEEKAAAAADEAAKKGEEKKDNGTALKPERPMSPLPLPLPLASCHSESQSLDPLDLLLDSKPPAAAPDDQPLPVDGESKPPLPPPQADTQVAPNADKKASPEAEPGDLPQPRDQQSTAASSSNTTNEASSLVDDTACPTCQRSCGSSLLRSCVVCSKSFGCDACCSQSRTCASCEEVFDLSPVIIDDDEPAAMVIANGGSKTAENAAMQHALTDGLVEHAAASNGHSAVANSSPSPSRPHANGAASAFHGPSPQQESAPMSHSEDDNATPRVDTSNSSSTLVSALPAPPAAMPLPIFAEEADDEFDLSMPATQAGPPLLHPLPPHTQSSASLTQESEAGAAALSMEFTLASDIPLHEHFSRPVGRPRTMQRPNPVVHAPLAHAPVVAATPLTRRNPSFIPVAQPPTHIFGSMGNPAARGISPTAAASFAAHPAVSHASFPTHSLHPSMPPPRCAPHLTAPPTATHPAAFAFSTSTAASVPVIPPPPIRSVILPPSASDWIAAAADSDDSEDVPLRPSTSVHLMRQLSQKSQLSQSQQPAAVAQFRSLSQGDKSSRSSQAAAEVVDLTEEDEDAPIFRV